MFRAFGIRAAAALAFATMCAASVVAPVGVGAQTLTPASEATVLGPNVSYSSMAIDPVNDHVFVSLPSKGTVDVFDFSGNLVATITGLGTEPESTGSDTDANSLVYADGAVYVTDTENGTVDQIDPNTLSLVGTVATGLTTPYDLVFSNGSLWTTTGASWPPRLSYKWTPGAETSRRIPACWRAPAWSHRTRCPTPCSATTPRSARSRSTVSTSRRRPR